MKSTARSNSNSVTAYLDVTPPTPPDPFNRMLTMLVCAGAALVLIGLLAGL